MIEDDPQHRVSASLRHLKLFESVARLQSVGRASEECCLSQPAATHAIAKLEEQIGVTLLERRVSGTYLNEFGEIFYRRIQRLFAQIERALMELGVPGAAPVGMIASRITRSKIRSLVAIVENGSFAQAARALCVSQTSLQRAARDLERTVQTPLYVQTAFGLIATPAGAEFARKLKLAMRELDSAVEELEAARGNCNGEIVVGAMLLTGSVVLASVLNEFSHLYPKAGIRVQSSRAGDIMSSLRSGDVDFVFGLLRDPAPNDLVSVPLAKTPFVVAARHGHPLARKSKVTLDELADYEWVVGTPEGKRRAQFEQLFAGRPRPTTRVAIGPPRLVRLMVADSDYLTLLTSYQLFHEGDALTALPFGPIEPAPVIGLSLRENWLPTQLQSDFIALVQKRFAGLMTSPREFKRAS